MWSENQLPKFTIASMHVFSIVFYTIGVSWKILLKWACSIIFTPKRDRRVFSSLYSNEGWIHGDSLGLSKYQRHSPPFNPISRPHCYSTFTHWLKYSEVRDFPICQIFLLVCALPSLSYVTCAINSSFVLPRVGILILISLLSLCSKLKVHKFKLLIDLCNWSLMWWEFTGIKQRGICKLLYKFVSKDTLFANLSAINFVCKDILFRSLFYLSFPWS